MWSLMDKNITAEDKKCLQRFLLDTDRYTNGPKVKAFEKAWCEWLGIENSLMVNSGASGNYLTVALMKHLRGCGEVIVPALGWSSDVSSLCQLGMTPVFVDVDIKTMGLKPADLKKAINKNTVGVVIVHGLGFNALTTEVLDILQNNNLFVIEDCCEAHGAVIPALGKKAGRFGDVSVFSFYYGHHMTTIEGGMVCTSNSQYHQTNRMLRSHGMTRETDDNTQQKYAKDYPNLNPSFTFAVPGFNFRSTEFNAVLGLSQLTRLNANVGVRNDNLKLWLACLDPNIFETDFCVEGSSNFALPLCLRKKDEKLFKKITDLLTNEEVEYRVGTAGGGNLAKQPFLEQYRFKMVSSLKNVDHLHSFALYVGNGQHVTEKMISTLGEKLNAVIN